MEPEIRNHVVNFSGGRTSAYMVWLFEQKRKREDINVEYIFCDTGAEHPNTYKFINNVVEHFKIKLTCLRTVIPLDFGVGPSYRVVDLSDCKQDLQPFLDVCKKNGTPTVAAPLCSDRMKSIPADKYCNDKYGRFNYWRWLGIRVDEQRRIKTSEQQIDAFMETKKIPKRQRFVKYLANISDLDKQDVLNWWQEQPFNLDLDEHLGNCVFCIKKGANKIALAAKDEPEMAVKFIGMINDERVAQRKSRGLPPNIMYRDNQSLESIVAAYDGIDRETLKNQILYGKQLDSGSCSESCEANFDLFDDGRSDR